MPPIPNIDGIDTSPWQTIIGPQPPLTFAIEKASDGYGWPASTFVPHTMHYRAQPHIDHVGAYHWLRSNSTPARQFDAFRSAVDLVGGLRPQDFALLDWERTYVTTTERQNGIMRTIRRALPDPMIEQVEEWCRLADREYGFERVMVYSAPWVPGFVQWRARNPHRALIIARYITSGPLSGWTSLAKYNPTAWQWTSSAQVSGFTGRVDANHIFDRSWFDRLKPTPKPPTTEDDMYPTIINVTGAKAQFIGKVALTANLFDDIEWTGPGSDPKVKACIAAKQAAGARVITVPMSALAQATLHGPLPVGDSYTWTGNEFRSVKG